MSAPIVPKQPYRVLLTQGGTTRILITRASSVGDAINNISDDVRNMPANIIVRPLKTEEA